VLWKWIKKTKDFNSWYSFGSNIVRLIVWIGLFSGLGASVVGVTAAIIKGVPWPIILMSGVSLLIAVGGLAVTPLLIRASIQSLAPNKIKQPIAPHWDAWKHVEKFKIYQAAHLLANLEPSIHQRDPKIQAWITGLTAAISTGKLDFIVNRNPAFQSTDSDERVKSRQMKNPNMETEISRAALVDFAKQNNIELKQLSQ
jgi:hypothetical protein